MSRPADWIVAVPLKPAGARKTRLAGRLDAGARDALAEAMFAHVLGVVGQVAGARPLPVTAARPAGWTGAWRYDAGDGLNGTLAALRAAHPVSPFAVIHADLPHLVPADVAALLAAGHAGLALAPDRHGGGTNALAVAPRRPLAFRFGPASLTRFAAEAAGDAIIVRRAGLALDVDTPEDLHLAYAGRPLPDREDRAA